MSVQSLSLAQARKLVLCSQGVHRQSELGQGKPAARRALSRLGYVQIDTISVIERAHHHTLWNRASHYQTKWLEQLVRERQVFEYWSHAAAYLPIEEYRYTLPRKQAIASGQKHWFDKDPKLAAAILERVRLEGPLRSKDFEHKRKDGSAGWWEWKPAKRMLEQLFMEGELMISQREGFQKVYDLTERVLPSHIDTTMPSKDQFLRYLIRRYLRANGVGTPSQIAYLRTGLKASVERCCESMNENGDLVQVQIGDQRYFALPDFEVSLGKPVSRARVCILSPFDNLLIQRARTAALFDFDYQIECYVPANKRKYGYFVLPILWGQRFAGRLDAKIDRKNAVLHVFKLNIETKKAEEFCHALSDALSSFLCFNHGKHIHVHHITHFDQPIGASQAQRLSRILASSH